VQQKWEIICKHPRCGQRLACHPLGVPRFLSFRKVREKIGSPAYLLGMAIADDLILAIFDKRIGHLAGEHGKQVLILGA
jgi:hypothetical protein